jgi:hypothetical protein
MNEMNKYLDTIVDKSVLQLERDSDEPNNTLEGVQMFYKIL